MSANLPVMAEAPIPQPLRLVAKSRPTAGRKSRDMSQARRKEIRGYQMWVNGATPQQIAATPDPDHPGHTLYGSVEAARDAIERASQYMGPIAEIDTLRHQQLAGLVAQRLDLNRRLAQRHPILGRDGQPILVPERQPDGSFRNMPVEDHSIAARLHGELRQVDARIGSLMGTDAAKKYEMSGPGGGPVELDMRVAALKDRMSNIRLLDPPPPPDVIDVEEA